MTRLVAGPWAIDSRINEMLSLVCNPVIYNEVQIVLDSASKQWLVMECKKRYASELRIAVLIIAIADDGTTIFSIPGGSRFHSRAPLNEPRGRRRFHDKCETTSRKCA